MLHHLLNGNEWVTVCLLYTTACQISIIIDTLVSKQRSGNINLRPLYYKYTRGVKPAGFSTLYPVLRLLDKGRGPKINQHIFIHGNTQTL